MKTFTSRGLWSRILIVLGSIGMLAGAIDPMEGSVVIRQRRSGRRRGDRISSRDTSSQEETHQRKQKYYFHF
jgi:hypothetical protein